MVYVILKWHVDSHKISEDSFKVCGVFDDESTAIDLLDKLQMDSYLKGTNNYYWVEPMKTNELQEQWYELQ